MAQSNLVVSLSVEEFSQLIHDEVNKVVSNILTPKKPELPDRLQINEAVKYLNEIGFPVSKSYLQKRCALGAIPYEKCGKKCVFLKKDLRQFADNNSVKLGRG